MPIEVSLSVAIIGGILSFFSPCVLPLIPGYLVHISGSSLKEVKTGNSIKLRGRIFANAVLFSLGFSIVFIILGLVLAGTFGNLGPSAQVWLARIGGAVIILFGLHTMDLIRIPILNRGVKMDTSHLRIGYLNSTAIGAAFGVGWTPCFGPILASILIVAGTSGSASVGGLLLGGYAIGLAVPFLLTGLFTDQVSLLVNKLGRRIQLLSWIAGILLVGLGIIVFTNSFARLLALLPPILPLIG